MVPGAVEDLCHGIVIVVKTGKSCAATRVNAINYISEVTYDFFKCGKYNGFQMANTGMKADIAAQSFRDAELGISWRKHRKFPILYAKSH